MRGSRFKGNDSFLQDFHHIWTELHNHFKTLEDSKMIVNYILERIIFLYYLQENGVIPSHILQEGVKKCTKNQNYYQMWIAPLCLALTNRIRPKSVQKFTDSIDSIPYLNANLFAQIDIPEIFVPLTYWENIFEQFQKYNWTFGSNQQQKSQVSPNILSQLVESSFSDPHESGSYYTPIELTEYICEKALDRFLCLELNHQFQISLDSLNSLYSTIENQEPKKLILELKWIFQKLNEITICDNACGAGEFLISVLSQLISIFNKISSTISNTQLNFDSNNNNLDEIFNSPTNRIQFLEKILSHSIYGVDINTLAIEVARHRCWLFWLSNLIEFKQNSPKKESIKWQFPDFDLHLRQGDSLLGFDWEREFAEIFNSQRMGFDLIIGNPPYIKSRSWDWLHKESYKKEILLKFQKKYPALAPSLTQATDLLTYFILESHYLLCPRGINAYLTSNKWFRTTYGKPIRTFFSDFVYIDRLVDFTGIPVFKNASVDVCIYFFQKISQPNPQLRYYHPETLTKIEVNEAIINQKSLTLDPWDLNIDELGVRIRQWIDNTGIKLKNLPVTLGKGLETGYNSAFVIDSKSYSDFCSQDPRYCAILKPFILGECIDRYRLNWNNQWIVFIPWHFPLQSFKETQNAETMFQTEYPDLYTYLSKFRTQLKKRAPSETGRYEWYALKRYAASYYYLFESPKIVWQELANQTKFVWDPNHLYPANSAYMMANAPKYYTLILNSNVIDFYFGQISKNLGKRGRRHTTKFIERIPMPILPKKIESMTEKLNSLTDYMHYVKTNDICPDLGKYCQQIVYELYFQAKFVTEGLYSLDSYPLTITFCTLIQPIPFTEYAQLNWELQVDIKSNIEETKIRMQKIQLLESQIRTILLEFNRNLHSNLEVQYWSELILRHPWIEYLEKIYKRRT